MGELYRYIFSQYHALDTARQALTLFADYTHKPASGNTRKEN